MSWPDAVASSIYFGGVIFIMIYFYKAGRETTRLTQEAIGPTSVTEATIVCPKYSGCYSIGSVYSYDCFKIYLVKKPNFIRRFCMKYLMGWTWQNYS